jgi:signal transduction histidine kinase
MNQSTSPNTIEIVRAALVWLALYTAEVVVSYLLRHTPSAIFYYYVAIAATIVLVLVLPLLGRNPLIKDIQEICVYDIFVQIIGLLLCIFHGSEIFYLVLSEFILVLKIARVTWPLFSQNGTLPPTWPQFGLIALFSKKNDPAERKMPLQERMQFYRLLPIFAIAAIAMQLAFVIAAIPITAIATVIFTFRYTRLLTTRLEDRERAYIETERALGIAEGEAAAQAKSVAELTSKNAQIEQQAAELAVKNAQLEQQALELAANNRTLEALAAERAAMMADLAARNISLRDANHDYKVPMLELMTYVERAQELATDDTQATMLSRLDRGLDELRTIMGDIIEQAKVSTELTTPPLQRVEVADMVEFFYQRFEEKAEKRGVEFDIQAPAGGCAVFTNELLLRRIITNLANNAIMYAESGREVEIRFRCSPSRCYVRVKDTGPGIPMANGPDRAANFTALIERIKVRRQPITAYADEGQGHGLGLQIIARLCGELGTSITLQSRPGLGTVFRFSVPLAT